MIKRRSLMRWVGRLSVIGVLVLVVAGAQGIAALKGSASVDRPDAIRIDAMAVFGELERPPVTFLHDAHTEAVARLGKDCSVCHLKTDKGRSSIKYMRLKDTDRESVMAVYHANCIECHKSVKGQVEKTGPVTCNKCHDEKSMVRPAQKPMGFDASLHYRHDKATDSKCEQCHHVYDANAKKLVHKKGEEGTCRYCHGEIAVENRVSFREAAHGDCIDCHRNTIAQKKVAGPVQCAGCHDAERQAVIEKVESVPRMKRNQPSAVMVAKGEGGRMQRVPFDHKAHEGYSDNCRSCHHAATAACNSCHTVEGKKEGGFINLEKAMHRTKTQTSCIGCHDIQQAAVECAGCHVSDQPMAGSGGEACLSCHQVPPEDLAPEASAAERQAVAAVVLSSRTAVTDTLADAAIPEVVTIGMLSKEYQPAKMPHRKIVRKLVADMKDSRLAAFYHKDPGTICQGCHHNSPVSAKPPKCASCHGKPFSAADPLRPGLMGAYHQQCMNCHDAMKIKKPANVECTGCHLEKR